jgi:hypothetical protein
MLPIVLTHDCLEKAIIEEVVVATPPSVIFISVGRI